MQTDRSIDETNSSTNHMLFKSCMTISVVGLVSLIFLQIAVEQYLYPVFSLLIAVLIGYLNKEKMAQNMVPYLAIISFAFVSVGYLLSPTPIMLQLLFLYVIIFMISISMQKAFLMGAYVVGIVVHFITLNDTEYTLMTLLLMILMFTIFTIFLYLREQFFNIAIGHVQLSKREAEIRSDELEQQKNDLKRENDRLMQLNQAKEQILANTTHELRTPLNGMIGIADTLIDGIAGPLSDPVIKNLKLIITSGRRLSALVNDILDFSKMKNNKLELNIRPLSIQPVVAITLELIKQQINRKPIELVNEVNHSPLPFILGDENRLQQIFYNLLSNAIKFSEKGQITVSAKVIDNMMSITVRDQGIGIAEEHFDRLFQSYDQLDESIERKFGGTGLGLVVTKQLVQLHGGAIHFESQLGEGTAFTFTIPLANGSDLTNQKVPTTQTTLKAQDYATESAAASKAQISGSNGSSAQIGSRGHVMIIDDEPINIQVLNNLLTQLDYEITSCESGIEALAQLNEGVRPDLILLDVMMPRMSGYETLQNIRKRWSVEELPVILITAKNQPEDINHGFQCGSNDYIVKPFEKSELIARVKVHLQLSMANQRVTTMRDRLIKLLKERNIDPGV